MTQQASFSYEMTAQNLSSAAFQAKVSAVILDPNILSRFGVSLASDIVSSAGRSIFRSIIMNLLPQFTAADWAPINPQTIEFRGTVVSSSPQDALGGSGMVDAQLIYENLLGVRKSNTVRLEGTTPVLMIPEDHSRFISLAPLNSNAPVGQVGVYADGRQLVGRILNDFQGSILSTSEDDTAAGIGARQVTITYHDSVGAGPFVEVVTLNGTTPVNCANLNHATINNMQVTAWGSSLGNLGIISLLTGLEATGGTAGRLAQSFYTYFPVGTDQAGVFRNLYTYTLSAQLQTIVSASEPTIT